MRSEINKPSVFSALHHVVPKAFSFFEKPTTREKNELYDTVSELLSEFDFDHLQCGLSLSSLWATPDEGCKSVIGECVTVCATAFDKTLFDLGRQKHKRACFEDMWTSSERCCNVRLKSRPLRRTNEKSSDDLHESSAQKDCPDTSPRLRKHEWVRHLAMNSTSIMNG